MVKSLLSRIFLSGLCIAIGSSAFAYDRAQPPLPKENLEIKTKAGAVYRFSVEVAKTDTQKEIGEMFRTHIPDDGGMLFGWGVERPVYMWMRNTLVPLDMVFIDGQGKIAAIEENAVPHSEAIISSRVPVAYTLELKGGTVEKDDLRVGDSVLFPDGKS